MVRDELSVKWAGPLEPAMLTWTPYEGIKYQIVMKQEYAVRTHTLILLVPLVTLALLGSA